MTTFLRSRNRVWSRHLIFLGNQETVDKAHLEDSGEVVGYARGRQDTPATPLRRGYSGRFRAVLNLTGLELIRYLQVLSNSKTRSDWELGPAHVPLSTRVCRVPEPIPNSRNPARVTDSFLPSPGLNVDSRKFWQHLPSTQVRSS